MNILTIRNVTKQYAHHKALDDVSLNIPAQSVFGLLGPNGAGKTSLIRIITQITGPDSGEVLFKDSKLTPSDTYRMGYLPEERGLYKKMEVGEQLMFFAQLKGLSRTDAQQRLKGWVERFEIGNWWRKKVEELSKGMQQKIQFIATVLHEPELIILDEPFTGFDPINANLIRDEILRLNKNGASVIFSTHRMETVEQLCNHIALINKSKVVLEGEIGQVQNQFKTNQYLVEHKPGAFELPTSFRIDETHQKNADISESKITILQGNTNDLLAVLLQRTTVRAFSELIPGMNEIFIKAVEHSTGKPLEV